MRRIHSGTIPVNNIPNDWRHIGYVFLHGGGRQGQHSEAGPDRGPVLGAGEHRERHSDASLLGARLPSLQIQLQLRHESICHYQSDYCWAIPLCIVALISSNMLFLVFHMETGLGLRGSLLFFFNFSHRMFTSAIDMTGRRFFIGDFTITPCLVLSLLTLIAEKFAYSHTVCTCCYLDLFEIALFLFSTLPSNKKKFLSRNILRYTYMNRMFS